MSDLSLAVHPKPGHVCMFPTANIETLKTVFRDVLY
jgi:hypothetical protein